MAWHARLALHYERQGAVTAPGGASLALAQAPGDSPHAGGRTVARFHHEGPLRILQSLYPEGTGICHNVLVHPPSGLVAGDRLDIGVKVDAGAHGLVTTPGATRFYRSEGELAVQDARLTLAGFAGGGVGGVVHPRDITTRACCSGGTIPGSGTAHVPSWVGDQRVGASRGWSDTRVAQRVERAAARPTRPADAGVRTAAFQP